MVDSNKVSDKAKASLFRQQMALVDTIDESLVGDDTGWESYVFSVAPAYELTGENFELRHGRNLSIIFMEQFRDSVFSGVTPSTALLGHIAESFNKYLEDDSGKLTLDEAFKLKHQPRIGNPLKQKQWLQKRGKILLAMWLQRKLSELRGKKISISDAAAIVINTWNLSADEESLKKEYIALKIDESQESGYYPPTSECIYDLEKAFQNITLAYISGKTPKEPLNLDRAEIIQFNHNNMPSGSLVYYNEETYKGWGLIP